MTQQQLAIDAERDLMHYPQISWSSCARTHVGLVRTNNEDAYLDTTDLGLWVVADGMGGHAAGEVAAKTVVDSFRGFQPDYEAAANIDDLEARLIMANSKCLAMVEADEISAGMGSTAVVLYAQDQHCFVLWAGDSRVYHLRGNTLTQLTEDHSLVQEMFAMGHLTEEEAARHPSANVVTRAIGVSETLCVDIDYTVAEPGDRFLLCSDGLNRDLNNQEIGLLLQQGDINTVSDNLINAALHGGGGDNTTVVVVEATRSPYAEANQPIA